MNLHEPEQPPQEIVPQQFYTEEQLALQAIVDHMDRLMPWIFEVPQKEEI